MIATVKFISCPYNYSSRTFPVGDLSEYVMHTAEAKVTKDLGFSFTVPTFEDYYKVNMVEIDGSYYWVVSYNTRTLDNPTTTFTVAYNPVTSLLKENDTLKGVFERVPYTIDPNVSFSVKDDILVKERDVPFDNIVTSEGKKVAYVQVTSRRNEASDNNSSLTKYVALCRVDGGGRIGVKAYLDETNNVPARYPTLSEIINGLDDVCGLTADSVVDVSISMRSPYTIMVTGYNEMAFKFSSGPDFIRPTHKGITIGDLPIVMYDMTLTGSVEEKPIYTVSLTLSERERHLGYLSLLDEGFNKVAVIPKELCDESGKIELSIEAVSDYTGLYTHVYYGNTQLVIPEGKLPWVGDAWAEYQSRNMTYDREALALTIQTAKDQRMVDTVENAANSIINGSIAAAINPLAGLASVASFAVSAGADALQEQIDIRSATEELRISQARIKDSPSSYFNTGYGMSYITNSLKSGGACLRLEMPKNTTETEYNEYVQNYGVPISGFREINVQEGFVKGRLTESVFSGPRGDMLNTELINGVKVKFVKGGMPEPVNCTELLTMYKGDTSLIETPVINARNCTSLKEVFSGCSKLKTVGYIHCPNVTSMSFMFWECSSLTTIPLLNISNVTSMSSMFRECSSLTTIPLLNTSNVTSMDFMFGGCSSLTTIPSLNTSNATTMHSMFSGCSSLTTIPLLNISNVTYMTNMFLGCSVLTSVTFQCADVRPYNNNMFISTPIASGNGYIFVPDNLVQAYRTAEGWSAHASVIFGHSDRANMTAQVQQMTAMNVENKPSEEELQLMMQEFDDEELM